jgi:hypothetical protein
MPKPNMPEYALLASCRRITPDAPSIWTLPFYEWLAKGAIADDPLEGRLIRLIFMQMHSTVLDFDEHRFK